MAVLMKILAVAMAMTVQTALSDQQCECTIKGDPHVAPFKGSHYTLPLPCAHTITDVQIVTNTTTCVMKARGLAEYTDGLNGVSFERLIEISVFYNFSLFVVTFDGTGVPAHSFMGAFQSLEQAEITIDHSPSLGGQSTVTIEPCQLKLTYKPRKSSFTINMPMSENFKEGLCGNCNELWGGTTNPSTKLILKKNLEYLNVDFRLREEPVNIYPACDNLTQSVQRCQMTEVAEHVCGPILEHDVLKCINKAGDSNTEALEKFVECYNTYCFVNILTFDCTSALEGIFYDCAPQHISNVCGGAHTQ